MNQKNTFKLIAVATNFIFEMLIALVIGFFIGNYLDGLFEFNGLLAATFMVVLGAGAIWQFIRRLIKLGKSS